MPNHFASSKKYIPCLKETRISNFSNSVFGKPKLIVTDLKYLESLDNLEKSKTLKLCLKKAFRELSWKS